MEEAHSHVGGSGPGRRHALDHVNQAYVGALSAYFQRFCRDLHTESIDVLATSATTPMQALLRGLANGRKLDHGNPNSTNIQVDFLRLGLPFLDEVKKAHPKSESRLKALEKLNQWRNAIAHQDFAPVGGPKYVRLGWVQGWRSACNGLAKTFDGVMRAHLSLIVGKPPW